MNTIQSKWEELQSSLTNNDMSEDEMDRIRDLFYAGALAMLSLFMDIEKNGGTTKAKKEMLSTISQEALIFMAEKIKKEMDGAQ